MNCKNCTALLDTSHKYCAVCGARVILNRLTFNNLWQDFRERFLNFDNRFLKTFTDLFRIPEKVIVGYLSGTRKQYTDPISYFGIALTLSGILVFLIRNVFTGELDMDVFDAGVNQEVFREIYEVASDFQALVFVVFIPLIAFCGWLLYNRHRYYFSEHLVIITYTMAQFSIASFPISLVTLAIDPKHYTSYGLVTFVLMVFYTVFVYHRIMRYGISAFVWRTGVFLLVFFILYLIVTQAIMLVLILSGVIELGDLVPPQ